MKRENREREIPTETDDGDDAPAALPLAVSLAMVLSGLMIYASSVSICLPCPALELAVARFPFVLRGGECSMHKLDLGVEELEPMEAPGFWSWVTGIGVGVIVGGAVLYAGIAIT